MLFLFLVALGFFVGIISGMLGLGGGVLTIPALIILAPELGVKVYTMQQATAVSAFTSLFSSVTGFLTHYKKGFIPLKEIQPILITSLISGILGTWFSTLLSDEALQWLFFVVLLAILTLELKLPKSKLKAQTNNAQSEDENTQLFHLADKQSIAICSIMSFVVSQIGIGGSILFIPYLMVFKHVPIRYAIGAGSCFVITNAVAVIIGKVSLGILPWPDMAYVAFSAILGGHLGGFLSHKIQEKWLRMLLIVMMSLTVIRFAINLVL